MTRTMRTMLPLCSAILLLTAQGCRTPKLVKIETVPPGAMITIDGFVAGTSPCQASFPRRQLLTVEVAPPDGSDGSLFLQRRTVEWSRIPREGGVIFFDLRLRPAGAAVSNGASSAPSAPGAPAANTVTVSSGTAFLVDPQFVISASHIVEDSTKLLVTVDGLGDVEATIAARDSRNDICLLKLAVPIIAKPLWFAEPDSLEIGEPVYLLGFPLSGFRDGAPPVMTDGILASLQGLKGDPGMFQVTAATNPGNSGGPVVDSSGNVVGVMLSTLSPYYTLLHDEGVPQGVNFGVKGGVVQALLRGFGAELGTAPATATAMTAQQVHASVASRVFLIRAAGAAK